MDERDDATDSSRSSSSSGRRRGTPPVVQDVGVAPEERGGSHAKEEEACNSDAWGVESWLFWGGEIRKCKAIWIWKESDDLRTAADGDHICSYRRRAAGARCSLFNNGLGEPVNVGGAGGFRQCIYFSEAKVCVSDTLMHGRAVSFVRRGSLAWLSAALRQSNPI